MEKATGQGTGRVLARSPADQNGSDRETGRPDRLADQPDALDAMDPEPIIGLHRDRQILAFSRENFPAWWRKRGPALQPEVAKHKVVLFPSCMVNYQATDIGKATVQVLAKNRVEVVVPEGQRCCSMPSFDLGDTETMAQTATHHLQLFLPYLQQGYD
ncbi:MAG: hypothetical protein F4Z24_07525, partial [Nitrospira sp. SB0666_bin_27]|nr:hypothetical protein [Nitrospira sp. SB0666_bin_27]